MTAGSGPERIEDHDALLRRVPNNPDLYKRCEDGSLRVSSVALKPSSSDGGISVDLRRLLPDSKYPHSVLDEGPPGSGLVEFTASVPRKLGLEVEHAPIEENVAHCNVVGFDGRSPAEVKRLLRSLAKSRLTWVQEPAGA